MNTRSLTNKGARELHLTVSMSPLVEKARSEGTLVAAAPNHLLASRIKWGYFVRLMRHRNNGMLKYNVISSTQSFSISDYRTQPENRDIALDRK